LPDLSTFHNLVLETTFALVGFAHFLEVEIIALRKPQKRLISCAGKFSIAAKAILIMPNELAAIFQAKLI